MGGGESQVILDTSVLINFLRIDRMDLLTGHPSYKFAVTDHVRGEICDHYPDHVERLEIALENGDITETVVSSVGELAIFGVLVQDGRLGTGECSAIAAAASRALPLAIDDKRARARAAADYPKLELLNTEALMVSLIRLGLLGVDEADRIKTDWEKNHRFRLMFGSFRDVV